MSVSATVTNKNPHVSKELVDDLIKNMKEYIYLGRNLIKKLVTDIRNNDIGMEIVLKQVIKRLIVLILINHFN